MTETTCTCGASDAYSLTPGEVIVHRTDGPCYFADAITETPVEDL